MGFFGALVTLSLPFVRSTVEMDGNSLFTHDNFLICLRAKSFLLALKFRVRFFRAWLVCKKDCGWKRSARADMEMLIRQIVCEIGFQVFFGLLIYSEMMLIGYTVTDDSKPSARASGSQKASENLDACASLMELKFPFFHLIEYSN